jgi:hypothetical protein
MPITLSESAAKEIRSIIKDQACPKMPPACAWV